MLGFTPGFSQIAIEFERFKNFPNLIVADQFCREHLFQELMTMPNRNAKVGGQLMHPQIIGDHNGISDLTEGQHSTIC